MPTYHNLEKKTQISPQFLPEVPSLNPPTVEAENTRYSLPHILCTKLDHDPGSARLTHHFELQASEAEKEGPHRSHSGKGLADLVATSESNFRRLTM